MTSLLLSQNKIKFKVTFVIFYSFGGGVYARARVCVYDDVVHL